MRRVALSGGGMAHFIGPGMHTTDRINEPVTTGRPFREAYRRHAAKALANPAGP